MQIVATALPGVLILEPEKHRDHRGFLSETYNWRTLADHGISDEFIQDNHLFSGQAHTVRGLHYQIPPRAQSKIVRVLRGAIVDVAVDVRRDSSTFSEHVAVELSADNWRQLYIPRGFAHGLCTLEPDTEVIYKVSDYWSPEHERGLLWSDADLAIAWPVGPEHAIVVDRDSEYPRLKDATDLF